MLCKFANNPSGSSSPSSSSSVSSDEGIMDWIQSSSVQQRDNNLFPHQIGSVDSTCSSWPGHVWRREPSKYWLDSDLSNNNNNRVIHNSGRVSISSVCSDVSFMSECSDSSYISTDSDLFNSSDNEDGISSSTNKNPVSTISSSDTGEFQIQSCKSEDQNNNSKFEQDSNNNNYNKNNTVPTANSNSTTSDKSKKKSENPTKSRVLDDEGYILRAACVCLDETESKVLLVSSKKDPCSWLVPGGGMEAGEDMATAAVREAWEEAGVQGSITKYLGLFETTHQKGHKKHRTAVYVVSVKRVMADYPEAYLGRGRQWFTLEDALLHLARTRPLQSDYLQVLLA